METKVCTKCNIEQPISNYHKHGKKHKPRCSKCTGEDRKIYISKNRDKLKEKRKEKYKKLTTEKRYDNNIKKRAKRRGVSIDVILEEERISSICEKENKKYCYGCNQILDKSLFGKLRIGKDGLNTKCTECSKKLTDKYYKNNVNAITEQKRIYINDRRKKDNMFRILLNLRCRISSYLKNKNLRKNGGSSVKKIIGCSPKELKIHLEKQFVEGMSWDNYGLRGWHIDHIIPLSSAKTIEEAFALNHYTNLQPLWSTDNLKKGKKIIG